MFDFVYSVDHWVDEQFFWLSKVMQFLGKLLHHQHAVVASTQISCNFFCDFSSCHHCITCMRMGTHAIFTIDNFQKNCLCIPGLTGPSFQDHFTPTWANYNVGGQFCFNVKWCTVREWKLFHQLEAHSVPTWNKQSWSLII